MQRSGSSALLRIGVIGLGYWGPNLARNAARSPVTSLVALCDLDTARLEEFHRQYPSAAVYSTADDLLADPNVDAVVVATPVSTHFRLAEAALQHGKHVLVEKPFTSTSAEAEALVALAARHNRTIMVDHVFVYSPSVAAIRARYAAGELGVVQYIDSVRINLGLVQPDVNVIWDLVPHDLSIVDHLLCRQPCGVMATGSSPHGQSSVSVAYLHVDYGDGLLASFHVNWLSPVKIRHMLIGCTSKSVLYNDLDSSEPVKIFDRGVDVTSDPQRRRQLMVSYRSGDVVSPRIDKAEPLQLMIQHFASCAAAGTQPTTGGDQATRLVRVLEAADTSIGKGGAYVELARA